MKYLRGSKDLQSPMSSNYINRAWNRIEPLLPWSLAPNVSPLEAIHGVLPARLVRAGKVPAGLFLLAGALLIVGAIEPLIASLQERKNDWVASSNIVLSWLLLCLSMAICQCYTQRAASAVLGRMGSTPGNLTVKPSVKQIEFTAFVVGCIFVFSLLADYVTVHRLQLVGVALDAVVWVGFLLPTGARWLGLSWAISLNATALTANYCSTSSDYILDKLRNAARLRGWFDRQIGLLIFLLCCAFPKVVLESQAIRSDGVLWLLAMTLLALLSLPSFAVYYVVERYRSGTLETLAVRLRETPGTINDRLDYVALRTVKEPFSEWFLVASILASASGVALKIVSGSKMSLPMPPFVSDYFKLLLRELMQNPKGTICVVAFGVGMILLYLRQVGIDVKTRKL